MEGGGGAGWEEEERAGGGKKRRRLVEGRGACWCRAVPARSVEQQPDPSLGPSAAQPDVHSDLITWAC